MIPATMALLIQGDMGSSCTFDYSVGEMLLAALDADNDNQYDEGSDGNAPDDFLPPWAVIGRRGRSGNQLIAEDHSQHHYGSRDAERQLSLGHEYSRLPAERTSYSTDGIRAMTMLIIIIIFFYKNT